jgi:prepilin-type processing-associated H-X9-DG protein
MSRRSAALPLVLSAVAVVAFSVALVPAAARQEAPASAAAPAAVNRSTPEAALKAFVDAIGRADLVTAASVVEGAPTTGLNTEFATSLRDAKVRLSLADVKTYTAGDDDACVVYSLEASPLAGTGGRQYREFLILKRINGAWTVAAPAAGPIEAEQSPDGMLLTVARLLRDPEAANRANAAAKNAACLSNVKQIALAAMMYTQDYDEVFPNTPVTFKSLVMPYIKSEGVFHCPLDAPGVVAYRFNEKLAKKSLAVVEAPAETVMLYEGEKGKLNFRHDGKAVVGFADGHVKLVTPEEASKLRWTP